MDPHTFVSNLTASGFSLAASGEKLTVIPASRLSEPQRQFIRRHKPELLALLTGKPAPAPLPVPWPEIRDRIAQGWRAEFAPPDTDGHQAITWTPPGTWTSDPPTPEPKRPLPRNDFHPLTDAELACLVTETAKDHGLVPVAVWRWLGPEDIEALRSGDPDEAQAFRAAVVSACAGGRLVADGGHSLPFPGDPEDIREYFEERAAVLEFEHAMSREDAEREARRRTVARHGREP